MPEDRKSNEGDRQQSGTKQAPGRRDDDDRGTGNRQGEKGSGQGSGQKGGKQGNR